MAKHYPIRHVANWLGVSESTLRHRGLKSPVTHEQLRSLVGWSPTPRRWCIDINEGLAGSVRFYRTLSQADDYWVELREREDGFTIRWDDGACSACGPTLDANLADFFADGASFEWIAHHRGIPVLALEHAIRFHSITHARGR